MPADRVAAGPRDREDRHRALNRCSGAASISSTPPTFHRVIGGGESGSAGRPCRAEWARALRDRCVEHSVASFWKQWGGRTAEVGRACSRWPDSG